MNTKPIKELIQRKGGKLITYKKSDLYEYKPFLANKKIGTYLLECQTKEDYEASGICIGGDLNTLRRVNFELAPGSFIFPFGFLSIASDASGNGICIDSQNTFIYFASHSAFDEDMVYFNDSSTGELIKLPGLNYHNILKGLIFLSDDLERFLIDLLKDKLR